MRGNETVVKDKEGEGTSSISIDDRHADGWICENVLSQIKNVQ